MFRNITVSTLSVIVASQCLFPSHASAQTTSSKSALAIDTPFEVKPAGSDDAALKFQLTAMPALLKSINETFTGKQIKDLAAAGLDPFRLNLAEDSSVRLYFLGERASTSNTLGLSTTGGAPSSPDAAVIFPNASTSQGNTNKEAVRSDKYPLLPGDFVDLGEYKQGTTLDFFLLANAAKNGATRFVSTNTDLNRDQMVAAVSYSPTGSPYLVVAFEDSFANAEQDYEDLFFALEISKSGTSIPTGPTGGGLGGPTGTVGAPEPSLATGTLALALVTSLRRRRKH